MNDIEERKDLTERVLLLKEALEEGKIPFVPHLIDSLFRSYKNIKFAQDGLVIYDSVDATIRSASLIYSYLKRRETLKKQATLLEIQETYFDILKINFGEIYEEMIKKNSNPYHVAHYLSQKDDFVKDFQKATPDFLNYLIEFWKTVGETVSIHIEDQRNLKANFGGDLFPSYSHNIASVCGLYILHRYDYSALSLYALYASCRSLDPERINLLSFKTCSQCT